MGLWYEKFPCIVVVTSLNNSFQKFTHKGGNLRMMAFEGKVSAGDEMDFGIGQVALEGFGSSGDERRIVLAPDSQQRRLVVAKVLLELRIKSQVRAVVEDEVVLHLGTSGQIDVVEIEAVAVGADAAFRCAKSILSDDGLKGKG